MAVSRTDDLFGTYTAAYFSLDRLYFRHVRVRPVSYPHVDQATGLQAGSELTVWISTRISGSERFRAWARHEYLWYSAVANQAQGELSHFARAPAPPPLVL